MKVYEWISFDSETVLALTPFGLFENRRKVTWVLETTPKLIRRDLISAHNYNRGQVRSALYQRVATEIMIGGVKYHPTHKWYPGGTPLYGLNRDVPLVRVWFLTSLSYSCESAWRVLSAWLIWFAEWILFVLQVNKSNDYNVNFFYSQGGRGSLI